MQFAAVLAHIIPARTHALGQLNLDIDEEESRLNSEPIADLTGSNYDHSAQFHGYLADSQRKRLGYWKNVLEEAFDFGDDKLSGLFQQ